MNSMSSDRRISEVIAQLEADDYDIGPDRFQRLRIAFELESPRRGYLTARGAHDLRFILDVERALALERDHDGLALALAYLGYHTIPWDRVHSSAQKRADWLLRFLDRELHRASNSGTIGFPARRIPKLSRQVAKHYISTRAIHANPKLGPLRGVVERIATILLKVAYHDEPVREVDIISVLLDFGSQEVQLGDLPGQITAALNSARPHLLMNGRNILLVGLAGAASVEKVQATVMQMRQMLPALFQLAKSFGIEGQFPLEFGTYPEADLGALAEAKIATGLLNLLYASSYWLLAYSEAVERVQRFAAGNAPELTETFANITGARDAIKRYISTRYTSHRDGQAPENIV
jgi:hypothetical protein